MAFFGASLFGVRSGTPEPGYQVVARLGQVEIRQYQPLLAASVTVPGEELAARSAGFRRLAGFIFGGNTAKASISMTAPVAQTSAKIAMTAPVAQTRAGRAGWTISFYMPANYTLATLPRPNDPGIMIHEIPGATMAVYRYSGLPGAGATAKAHAALLAALAGSAWSAEGAPVDWFYDPPWTLPWARRNEAAVQVSPRD